MPDAPADADVLAFVRSLAAPVPHDLVDRDFLGDASFAAGGARTTTVELTDLDDALGSVKGECTWTVGPGDAAIAIPPPMVDTPPRRARVIQRVIDGYLAGAEATLTCRWQEPTMVCPDVAGPDCVVVADVVERPVLALAVASVDGALRLRGWRVFADE